MPRGEIVLEGVQIRRKLCDFAEDYPKIDRYDKGHDMKTASDRTQQERRVYDLGSGPITAKQSRPMSRRIVRLN